MTSPINTAVDITVRAVWATLDRKEKDYLKNLEREVYAQIKTIFQFNQNRSVVIFLKRELSPNAEYILQLQGFNIRLEKERSVECPPRHYRAGAFQAPSGSFSNGIVTELYRKALVLD